MSEYCCRIERAANGFTVEMKDPKIVAQNNKRAGKSGEVTGIWKDPNVEYVFKNVEEVLAFLGKALPTAMPLDEYETTFSKALTETEDDD
jgi:hypothetical protein